MEQPKALPEIKEADKPFWLALIFVAIFAVMLLIGSIGAFSNNVNVTTYVDKILVGITGIVGVIVGFYFKSKQST